MFFSTNLDEIAHVIRDRSTKQARAICSLRAQHRWCLTGTPIQNRVEDLGALLVFLRVAPFETLSVFNNYFTNPINAGNDLGIKRLQLLVGSIALRRVKDSVKDEIQLVPRINSTMEVQLNTHERDLYESSRRQVLQTVNHVYTKTGEFKGFCGILQSILALRQICDYGMNQPSSTVSGRSKNHPGVSDIFSGQAICEMCDKEFKPQESEAASSILPCMHVLCSRCLSKRSEKACPLCMANTSPGESKDEVSDEYDKKRDWITPSSKALALLENLRGYQATPSEQPIKRYEMSTRK